jgi:hypothetical protein
VEAGDRRRGCVATFSFFEPFIAISYNGTIVPVSAYRVTVGFDDVGQVDPALRDLPERARNAMLASLNNAIQHETGAPNPRQQSDRIQYYYLSAVLLFAVAAVAIARRQLGMFGGLFTVGAGLCAICGWTRTLLIERRMAQEGGPFVHAAGGATLLAVAGAIALVAGIGALLWMDPGGGRARGKILAVVQRGEGPIEIDMPTREQNAAIPTATLRRRPGRSDVKRQP